ncbi:hypothetical protein [Novosphingobium sp. SG707]|uniref:hypothetical protein n=1 Tax=Novosphingobium sp. SG707 TaxID=2586996 RepID=UPI00155584F0|nr:hypothetical protein [Novosphingobium sp. SG707]NKI99919.1 hypothetical protein [Novosphingobium sp. SG707]
MSFHSILRSAALVGGAMALLGAPLAQARERLTPEQQLAKIIKDRVPGKPVNCINLTEIRSTTIIDKTAIVYDMGSTIYVNRPPYPQSLDDDDVLITKTWGSQLCSVDIVQLATRGGGAGMWWRGSVGLGEFVPYTKPKAAPAPAAPANPAG